MLKSAIAAVALAALLAACTSGPPRTPRAVIDRALATAPGAAQPSRVVAAELAFARAAREQGQWTAFRETVAPGGVIHGRTGPFAAEPWLAQQANPAQSVAWAPRAVWMSCDGKLAVTRGRLREPDGKVGTFATVWQQQSNGDYRWIYDIAGLDDPQPPAGREPEGDGNPRRGRRTDQRPRRRLSCARHHGTGPGRPSCNHRALRRRAFAGWYAGLAVGAPSGRNAQDRRAVMAGRGLAGCHVAGLASQRRELTGTDPPMLELFVSAFITLFVVIDPPGCAPIYAGLTKGATSAQARTMAIRATIIAGVILVIFALFGEALLGALHIELDSFRIAGGLMLFWIAFEMVFEKRTQRREERAEKVAATPEIEDVSVFPMAMPMLAGPGAIASVMLLTSGSTGTAEAMVVLGALFAVLLITMVALIAAGPLMRLFGARVEAVITRLLGVLLAALAAQYIIDGLRGSFGL